MDKRFCLTSFHDSSQFEDSLILEENVLGQILLVLGKNLPDEL